MTDIITFGELLLRLSPAGARRIIQADSFDACFGGCEANVAVSASCMGLKTAFVSKIPSGLLGDAAIAAIRKYGVDCDGVVRGGNRLGIYYLEKGADARPSRVVYDRAGSSIAESDSSEFDWDTLLSDTKAIHLSGITPALSESCRKEVSDAVAAAKRRGVTVSFDLNFRGKLWSAEKAGNCISGLIPGIDILIANEEHCKILFGVAADDIKDEHERIIAVAKQMSERFGIAKVVITMRKSISSFDNCFSALLYDRNFGESFFSVEYPIHIVDRVGGGDAFAAGLLYCVLTGKDPKYTIEFAAAAGVLKHSIEGDFSTAAAGEVDELVRNGRSGRLAR